MNQVKILSVATLSVLVAACGGGGGGGDVSVPVPAPVPAAAPATLVTTVAAPTYAAAGEELSAYNTLNAERERCGFGKLAQNAQLDLAARDHSLWRLTNNVVGHVQDPVAQPNGFTGRTPDERAVFRGYVAAQVRETINVRLPVPKAGMGAVLTRGLLAAPYHALALLDGAPGPSGPGDGSGVRYLCVGIRKAGQDELVVGRVMAARTAWLLAEAAKNTGSEEVAVLPDNGDDAVLLVKAL